MPSHRMLINIGSKKEPIYVYAYNKHGKEYEISIDNQGTLQVAHQDNIAYQFSHDDRLWPIYRSDNNHRGRYYPWTEEIKVKNKINVNWFPIFVV